MEVTDLVEESLKDNSIITLEATVVTGFEFLALEECQEKCEPSKIIKAKGRIIFNIPKEKYSEVKRLRCVDNLYLVGAAKNKVQFLKEKDKDLESVKGLVNEVNWEQLVGSWAALVDFRGVTFTTDSDCDNQKNGTKKEEEDKKEEGSLKAGDSQEGGGEDCDEEGRAEDGGKGEGREVEEVRAKQGKIVTKGGVNKYKRQLRGSNDLHGVEGQMIKYRVTCHRTGEHSFTSMEAARDYGGCLQDKFNWTVDLSNYDLEVVLNISDGNWYTSCGLTHGSLHRRNIVEFTATTLRATLCYGLLRLADPKKGDIVVDPLCGSGSISIEGSIAYPGCYQICGDRDKKSLPRCHSNVTHLGSPWRPELLSWDCGRLPLRTASVDVVVTDLPFGKRSGKKYENLNLYKRFLFELGRVLRPSTGRAALLTSDKHSLSQALNSCLPYWKGNRQFGVNQGGLNAFVFLLYRTSKTIHL